MSRLAGDPHPRSTRKPSSGFTSAAARLLLRHGRREAANGESIEFFSALRKCLPDPHVSGQTARGAAQPADGKGTARRGGSGGSADEVLSLSSGIGKHDYDWLLTPPGTPPWSPATSTSGHHQVSAVVPSRPAAGSASYGKSNSRLGPTGLEKERPTTSRLSNCSSATSINVVPSGRLLRVRTSSASSINTSSNASMSSTPLASAGSSPRTPAKARSPAATAIAQIRRRDKARVATSYVVVQSRAAASKSKPGAPEPTCTRAHPTPGVSSPRSTANTSRQPSLARRADVATPRSRLASQSSGAGSTPQPRDAHQTWGASGVALSSNGVKPRQVPAAVKHDGVAAASTTTQRWRQSLGPAIAAARNVRRENSLDKGSPRYSSGPNIINDEKTRPRRTATAAMGSSGLTRTGSWKSANTTTIVKRTVDQNEDCRLQDARHCGAAGAPDNRKPVLPHQDTRRSVTSRSRLGLMAATSKSGSITNGHRSTSGSCQHQAVAKVIASGPDAFPSTRYDAMLLREDPKNLTWLRGCDEGDDGSIVGLDLVDGSLEPIDVATGGLSRTAVRI
ncbi:hypothetical protein BAE44_0018626 [Dichanthelium oligosanthes]|uniref:Uncharacterized protein n=1 Tax=Dichanthelium oligosanthes TaxID=888268 RepID=A0A1E5V5P2_9POAL|nr:hypothetical protein BAE44_0018626 [Dichanthelium oligosanthes]